MSVNDIVRHCAPTLSGVKIGSLVTYRYDDEAELREFVAKQDAILSQKGVRVEIVCLRVKTAVLFVYRKKQLAVSFSRPAVQEFLSKYGYSDFSVEGAIETLKLRLKMDSFPHEVGVFLGYPLLDIQAFIDNKGANAPYVGFWKAYTNIDRAKRIFKVYQRCITESCRKYENGMDILQLTVAG